MFQNVASAFMGVPLDPDFAAYFLQIQDKIWFEFRLFEIQISFVFYQILNQINHLLNYNGAQELAS